MKLNVSTLDHIISCTRLILIGLVSSLMNGGGAAAQQAPACTCRNDGIKTLEVNIEAARRKSYALEAFSKFAAKCLGAGCPRQLRSPGLVLDNKYAEFSSVENMGRLSKFSIDSPQMKTEALISYITGSVLYPTPPSTSPPNGSSTVAQSDTVEGASYIPLGISLQDSRDMFRSVRNPPQIPSGMIPNDYRLEGQNGLNVPDVEERAKHEKIWRDKHGGRDLCDIKDEAGWKQNIVRNLTTMGVCKEIIDDAIKHEYFHRTTCKRVGFFAYANMKPDERAAEEAEAYAGDYSRLVEKHLSLLKDVKWKFEGEGTSHTDDTDLRIRAAPDRPPSTRIEPDTDNLVSTLELGFEYDLPVLFSRVIGFSGGTCAFEGPNPLKKTKTNVVLNWLEDVFAIYAGAIDVTETQNHWYRECPGDGIISDTPELPYFWTASWHRFAPGISEGKINYSGDNSDVFTPRPGTSVHEIHTVADDPNSKLETILKISYSCN
jgi:hypothetical protein